MTIVVATFFFCNGFVPQLENKLRFVNVKTLVFLFLVTSICAPVMIIQK